MSRGETWVPEGGGVSSSLATTTRVIGGVRGAAADSKRPRAGAAPARRSASAVLGTPGAAVNADLFLQIFEEQRAGPPLAACCQVTGISLFLRVSKCRFDFVPHPDLQCSAAAPRPRA